MHYYLPMFGWVLEKRPKLGKVSSQFSAWIFWNCIWNSITGSHYWESITWKFVCLFVFLLIHVKVLIKKGRGIIIINNSQFKGKKFFFKFKKSILQYNSVLWSWSMTSIFPITNFVKNFSTNFFKKDHYSWKQNNWKKAI